MTANRWAILQGTFGCSSVDHAGPDPWPTHLIPVGKEWLDQVRGDGQSYTGIIEEVERRPGEALDSWEQRVISRARVLDERLGCQRCR